jgi:hypothetical protein
MRTVRFFWNNTERYPTILYSETNEKALGIEPSAFAPRAFSHLRNGTEGLSVVTLEP